MNKTDKITLLKLEGLKNLARTDELRTEIKPLLPREERYLVAGRLRPLASRN